MLILFQHFQNLFFSDARTHLPYPTSVSALYTPPIPNIQCLISLSHTLSPSEPSPSPMSQQNTPSISGPAPLYPEYQATFLAHVHADCWSRALALYAAHSTGLHHPPRGRRRPPFGIPASCLNVQSKIRFDAERSDTGTILCLMQARRYSRQEVL